MGPTEKKVIIEEPSDKDIEETKVPLVTTEQPTIDIFNSTDLVLSKFTLNDQEEEVVTEETLVTSPSETIRPNVITTKEKFSPTAIPTEEKKKSRRRKFFRKQRHKTTPEPETDQSTTSAESEKPTSRPM